ncbi:DDHD domain-containing protein [Phascolomyces articulosus]|uniref:DDHD domain-containing protein n=1 Tax=Phascolomyces articulosus TaxID=60185 RepID=A0AAD5JTP8_9FUNG|nr:DDHD domain-containing protein [Phascolomyces articulosus]
MGFIHLYIEWHSILHALVDSKMDQATLDNVPKVRLATNQWLMDCMYYFSKPYGQFIIDAICLQCNEAYHLHGAPKHVHMIGFSLGGVAAYDILSMQWDNNMKSMDESTMSTSTTSNNTHYDLNDLFATTTTSSTTTTPQKQYHHEPCMCTTPNVCVPKLDFEVEHLFTCGSPIAAALVFRGLDYMHYRPPSCTRIHNIFHPYDPLGYRLEPMINPNFVGVSPVRLARAPPRRRRLLILPRIPDLGIKSFITQYMMLNNNSNNTTGEGEEDTTATTTTMMDNDHPVFVQEEEPKCENHHHEQRSSENIVIEEEQESEEFFPRRIDYMLNETVIDTYASEWIIALKSHFRYWANRDLAFHIAKSLLEL